MRQTDLKNESRKTVGQIVRYLFSGGIAFAADFLIMILLVERWSVPESVAGTISFGVGIAITYTLSVVWIFDQHRFSSRLSEFFLFVLIGAVGLVLTYVLMSWGQNMEINYVLNKIGVTVIVTLWNFIAKKYLLFSKKK